MLVDKNQSSAPGCKTIRADEAIFYYIYKRETIVVQLNSTNGTQNHKLLDVLYYYNLSGSQLLLG